MSAFDGDAAVKRCANLWRRLGGIYEKAAYKLAAERFPKQALECARMADVCFWQATGDLDCISMRDVLPKDASQ